MLPNRSYPSKILLFGEYSVILGSEALALPYPMYGSQWIKAPGQGPVLDDFVAFIETLEEYDAKAIHRALSSGWTYKSTIPIGYGLGSSGALSAAVYDAFRKEKEADVKELQNSLAQLEGFFHGASSGTDPLISYLDAGIHLKGEDNFELLPESLSLPDNLSFFLIDTGIARSTAPLVKQFLDASSDQTYKSAIENELSPLVKNAIGAFRRNQSDKLLENWKAISHFQWEHFHPMIPEVFRPMWEQGLQEDQFFLKLCGAGGGGFLLGLSPKGAQIPESITLTLRPSSI